NAISNIFPRIAAVIAAVEAPVVLQVIRLWSGRVMHDLVHALAKLRILLREKFRANALIPRLPRCAPIVSAVDTASRHGHQYAFMVGWIKHNCVQALTAATWGPFLPMRMIEQFLSQRPGFSAIIGLEECARLYTTVQLIRLVC